MYVRFPPSAKLYAVGVEVFLEPPRVLVAVREERMGAEEDDEGREEERGRVCRGDEGELKEL
jgi:hypothetical protein